MSSLADQYVNSGKTSPSSELNGAKLLTDILWAKAKIAVLEEVSVAHIVDEHKRPLSYHLGQALIKQRRIVEETAL